MTPPSGTGAAAGSTGTVLFGTATWPRPFTVPLPVPPVLRHGQQADDGYPEEEALPLPTRQRNVPLMICGRAFAADPERLERARYRLALDSPPPQNPTRQGHNMNRTVTHILLGAASGILAGLVLTGPRRRAGGKPALRAMSTSVLDETTTSGIPATAGPYFAGGLAALSVGAAAIHFAVTFEHFNEYLLYGVFFLVIAWAQMIWAAVAVWRLPRWWLWLGIAGNAAVVAVYLTSRTTGLPFGPDNGHPEPLGALDVVSALMELALIAGCAALLWRPSLADRPVRRRTGFAAIASMAAVPAAVIAATVAVMTPGWAGPEGPAGMASGMTSSSMAAPGAQPGMGDMGTTDGLPDMRMYGSAAPATAAQVIAAGQLVKATDATLARFRTETAGHRSVT